MKRSSFKTIRVSVTGSHNAPSSYSCQDWQIELRDDIDPHRCWFAKKLDNGSSITVFQDSSLARIFELISNEIGRQEF